MPSWVDDQARIEATIYRDGPEVWRNLKLSLRQAIEDYTRIYTPAGMVEVEFTDCAHTTENCLRVRAIPQPGKPDTSYEITFSIDKRTIECSKQNTSFWLALLDGKVIIQDKDNKTVSIEDVSRA